MIEAHSRARLALHGYGLRAGRVEEQDGVITTCGSTDRGRDRRGDRVQRRRRARRRAPARFHGPAAGVRGRGRRVTLDPRALELRPPRIRRREGGWRRAARRYWPLGVAGASALGWYAADSLRHRREGAFGYEIDDRDRRRLGRFPARRRGAHRSADLDRQPRRAADQRRPDLPRLPRDDRRGRADAQPADLRLLARRDRRRGRLGGLREGARGRPLQRHPRRPRLGADGAQHGSRRCATPASECSRFRPPKPYAIKRAANRTHRRALIADGTVGMTGGVGIAAEWTGDADGPDHWRDTHVRVRGPVVRGLQGAFAENWLEGTGEVLAGDDVPPRPRASRRRRADAGRALERRRSATPTPRPCTTSRSPRPGRSLELTRGLLRPRPAFTEALCDAAERGVAVRVLVPGPQIDKGCRPRRRPSLLHAAARPRACGSSSTSRQCCTRRRCCVDGAWSSVGTINFDNRSFQLHDEITLGIWDERFAAELGAAFERDLERSRGDRPRPLAPSRSRPAARRGRDDRSPPRALTPILRAVLEPKPKGRTWARSRARSLIARRSRHPVLAAVGDADQAVLRALRARGHQEPVETIAQGARDGGRVCGGLGRYRRRRRDDRRPPPRPVVARRRGRPARGRRRTSWSSSPSGAAGH